MTDMSEALRKLVEEWRSVAKVTRNEADAIPHLMARGHMNGLADGLDFAGDDVERLLAGHDRPTPPAANKD